MKRKKQFVSPRVVQEVGIQLEKDLLTASIWANTSVTIMGQEYEDHDVSYMSVEADVESYWE